MNDRLAGVVAVVTGGGSGIGRGVVEAYLADGADVVVVERSQESADALRREHPRGLAVVVGDAAEPEVLAQAVARASALGGRFAHLTCCVGIHDSFASIKDLDPGSLANGALEIWRTNVLSTLLAANVAHEWLSHHHGSITLTLSESAFHVTGGGVLYGSSKWALRGVVAHLAIDLGPLVRVNAVAPGGTTGTRFAGSPSLGPTTSADKRPGRDRMIADGNALGVVPTPGDHAAAYVYLADPEAGRAVSGAVINVDGARR